MKSHYSYDIVLFGGGIAGLWLLHRLRQAGYDAILFESSALGSQQTFSSQGIIHGGLKYTLSGSLNKAANNVAGMPERWRACFKGHGEIDLSEGKITSAQYYMWSNSGLRSKLKAFLGSKSLAGRISVVEKPNYPKLFDGSTINGTLYQLPDFTIDTESVVQSLFSQMQEHIYSIDNSPTHFELDEKAEIDSLIIDRSNSTSSQANITVKAQRFIFSAGIGNEQLISSAGLKKPLAQRRPLQMVYLSKPNLPNAYVHIIGSSPSLNPQLTITSHKGNNGEVVWYLGGEVAENGVEKPPEILIHETKLLLKKLVPWVDYSGAAWNTILVDRAEGQITDNKRPDGAVCIPDGNCLAVWPTKLTLAPALGDIVIEELKSQGIAPSEHLHMNKLELAEFLAPPNLAIPEWKTYQHER
ncbi:FAD-dependent oxidoreductase [Gammaproteobacteria bacterium]|nr:FAD-dependent oxidoreductase [Gammaproteobacteria bacterium]MDB2443716.1 FAD-dependent oxidoreductase [Gammaproteobacteria bacterium]